MEAVPPFPSLAVNCSPRQVSPGPPPPGTAPATAGARAGVTVLPARLFGVDRDLGTVEPGKLADLTVLDGDWFTDFDTLVRTVSVTLRPAQGGIGEHSEAGRPERIPDHFELG
ncbi:amidohydrolase family protein [Streptomyces sp. NPDC050564]|uniref:amidohydrolase family protein n=1 Tax=Streptomyces sp. NPDC050564 TaxID=3365631 RepID=UPI003799A1F2